MTTVMVMLVVMVMVMVMMVMSLSMQCIILCCVCVYDKITDYNCDAVCGDYHDNDEKICENMFLYFRSRIRVTPRFFEYKVLKLIINVKLNNIVMFLLPVLNPQISPLFKFTFLQVVWPNRGGGFGEIFVTSRSKPCLIFKFNLNIRHGNTKDTKIL